MFTTAGFFKSALEECADIAMKDDPKFNKRVETKQIKLTSAESNKQRKLYKIARDKCDLKYKDKNSFSHGMCSRAAGLVYNTDYKSKVIRDISPEENKRKYKKFISKSLKKKMNDTYSGYAQEYSECVNYKKRSPELFKAKYD